MGSSAVGQNARTINGQVEFAKIVPGPTSSGGSNTEGKTEGVWRKDKNRWRLMMELVKNPSISNPGEESTEERSSLTSESVDEVPIFFNCRLILFVVLSGYSDVTCYSLPYRRSPPSYFSHIEL
jgi:hypothetical protein